MSGHAAVADDERAAMVALSGLPGIGPAALHVCLAEVGPARALALVAAGGPVGAEVLDAALRRDRDRGAGVGGGELVAAARTADPAAILASHRAYGCDVVVYGDPGYPERLLDDPAPPALLFVHGPRHLLDEPAVAVVGTRSATRLGREWSGRLAEGLASRGLHIVSGLALGIDGAAHHAVLEAEVGGRPVGVIAGGLDQPYPHRHRALHQRVAAEGVLLTEAPLGCRPRRWRFPARNRIIAGLAEAVVVVESASAGGSMLTAAEALHRDRPVLAVPGHPASPSAMGTLDLIADGATPIRDLDDVLVALGRGGEQANRRDLHEVDGRPRHPRAVEAILADLANGPRSLGEIVDATGSPVADVAEVLSNLEVSGEVVRQGAWFEVAHRGGHGLTRGWVQ